MDLLNVLLTVVYVFCCLFLGFVVLIQKGEGGGLGGAFGGGAVDVAFGAKADMTWKRATAAAATLFMILAIVLGVLSQQLQNTSIAAQAGKAQKAAAGATPPGAPAVVTPAGEPSEAPPAGATPPQDPPGQSKGE